MKIRKLTASFGRLRGDTLAPGPGLNIIYAPNEGGKSTWCAFLRAMFYGIDTRGRDTKTMPAEKNRWQPWSGAPMEGEMLLTWGGRDVVLRRFSSGNTPFGGFSAADAATGETLGGLTRDNAGEKLLGVSRGVYERSAFIGQGAVPFSGERELEKRIAALVSSGEEETSYAQAEEQLREWLRRRKYNKTGLIPRLEGELADLEERMERLERAHRREEAAGGELQRLALRIKQLEAEREAQRRLEQIELDRRFGEAEQELQAAQAEERIMRSRWEAVSSPDPEDPRFPNMTPGEAWARAAEDAAEGERLGKRGSVPRALGIALLCAALAALVLRFAGFAAAFGIAAAVCAVCSAGCFLLHHRAAGRRRRARTALLARYSAAAPSDILAAAAAYREACARAEESRSAARSALEAAAARREGAQKLLDAMGERGGSPPSGTEAPPRTARSAAETHALLAAARGEYTRLNGDQAMARGEMNTLGHPAALTARREELKEELAKRRREYDALVLAVEELGAANSELQARFAPALNTRAGELFAALTGGKYDSVTLTRDFQAAAGETGGVLPRRAVTLSQGTVDQLYLAVRLAVCELVLPGGDPAPLVLDDALTSFDRARAALALDVLCELGKTRQILLFTCHRREGDILAGRADVTQMDLQT